ACAHGAEALLQRANGVAAAWRLDGDDEHLAAIHLDVGWMPPRLTRQDVFAHEAVDVRRVEDGCPDDVAGLHAGDQIRAPLERARSCYDRAVPEAEDMSPGVEPLFRVVQVPSALPLNAVGLRLACGRVPDGL